MNYLTALNLFLKYMEPLTPEERADAIAAFDTTMQADMARFVDAVQDLSIQIRKTFFWWIV